MRDQLSVRTQGNPELETPTLSDSLETGPANGSRGVDDRTAEILGQLTAREGHPLLANTYEPRIPICDEAARQRARFIGHFRD